MHTRRIIHILCFLLVVVVADPLVPAYSTSIDASIPPEAAGAIEAADWEKVTEILGPLADANEVTEPVHYWYAVARFHQEEHPDSTVEHLKAALEANPASLTTARYLARAATRMVVYEQALQAIGLALDAFGDDPVILRCAGRVEIKLHRSAYKGAYRDVTNAAIHLQNAQEYLIEAIAIDPSNWQARLDLAEVYSRSGQYESAIEHLLIVDRLQPLGHEVYVMLGQMYAKTGDHSRAADAFQIAIELAPAKASEIEWDLGQSLLEAGRSAEAVEIFRKVYQRNNMSTTVRFMFGRAAYDDEDYPLALFGFREAYTVDHNLDALVWSARCAYDLGQDEMAIQLVNRAIEEGKQRAGEDKEFDVDALWHFVRGRALWQTGDKKAAIDDLEAAALDDSDNAEYARWAVYAFRQLKDPYGVVRIAKAHGLRNDPAEAMKVIRAIRPMWRILPPRKDHRGKRYWGGIAGQSQIALAELYDKQGYSRTAAALCYSAGYKSTGYVNSWVSWLMYRGGNSPEAERMFRKLARTGKTDIYKQQGLRGLAFMALRRRDGQAARQSAEAVTGEYYQPIITTILKWADVFDNEADAVEQLDTFDLLGIYSTWLRGFKFERGLSIQGFIPGSPLVRTNPPLRPSDVVIRVGTRHLSAWESVERLRKEDVPEGETPVLVRRGERMFEVSVDFAAARGEIRELIPKPTEGVPK